MEKLEDYEMMPEDLDEIFYGDEFHCNARDITLNVLENMKAKDLEAFLKFAKELQEAYKHSLDFIHFNLGNDEQKTFVDLDPETRRALYLATMILHGIAYAHTQNENNEAFIRAHKKARLTLSEFVGQDDE